MMGPRLLRRRPAAVVLTLAVVGAIGVLYVEAVVAHLSVYQLPSSEAGLAGFSLTADGTAVEGTVRFTNAASREATFYGANILLYANGTTVAGPASTSTEQTTVGPGETVAVPARVDFADDRVPAGVAAYRNGTLTVRGYVYAGFGDQNFRIRFEPQPLPRAGGDADG